MTTSAAKANRRADIVDRQEVEIERLRSTIRAFGRGDIVPITDKDAEIEQLRAAIRWALGEEPDADGKWFGETYDEERKRYGWRSHLRKIAGLPTYTYDKERRTIVVEQLEPTPAAAHQQTERKTGEE
jgi:hypothetical protein